MKWLFVFLWTCQNLLWGQQSAQPKAFSLKETERAQRHNNGLNNYSWGFQPNSDSLKPLRPFSEIEEAGYLLFHSSTSFNSENIKNSLAKNLPQGMKLLVYTSYGYQIPELKRHYEALTGPGRVEAVELSYGESGRAIWARDNTPVPVLLKEPDSKGKTWALVDARYMGGDEPDLALASWFQVGLLKHNYNFEGGNFVTDSKGNCVIVNNSTTATIPDSIFSTLYGCQRLLRLRHDSGIGHADERVKFINDQVVLTDTPSYTPQLEALGYQVRLLPKPSFGRYRTYLNSLLMNQRVFVPVFNDPKDREALEVYQSLGLEVFPLDTRNLSDEGLGSIHCITMTYPKMALETLKTLFGLGTY